MAENSPHHSTMLIRGADGELYYIHSEGLEQFRLSPEQARELEAELAKRGVDLKHEILAAFEFDDEAGQPTGKVLTHSEGHRIFGKFHPGLKSEGSFILFVSAVNVERIWGSRNHNQHVK